MEGKNWQDFWPYADVCWVDNCWSGSFVAAGRKACHVMPGKSEPRRTSMPVSQLPYANLLPTPVSFTTTNDNFLETKLPSSFFLFFFYVAISFCFNLNYK